MDYEKDTRLAYMGWERAQAYKELCVGLRWARFSSWRVRRCVQKALNDCNLTSADIVMDIPCGGGVMADVLSRLPVHVVAADISREMMIVAAEHFRGARFRGFVQADIASVPVKDGACSCILVIGFLHRAPGWVRRAVLASVRRITRRFVIASYSLDSAAQRVKHAINRILLPGYSSAPSPVPFHEILSELKDQGFTVRASFRVLPLLSATIILLLERDNAGIPLPTS